VPNTQNGEIVQRMNYDEFGNVILDSKPGLPAFFLLYSPTCLEGEFSEVGLPLYGVLRSSSPSLTALLPCVQTLR
jgi:hypothetical protein